MIRDGDLSAGWDRDKTQIVVRRRGNPVAYITTPAGALRVCSAEKRVCTITGKEYRGAEAPSSKLLAWIIAELCGQTRKR